MSSWDGIYSGYLSGTDGQGFAMFIFYRGVLAGSDPLGVTFDGTYEESVSGTASGAVRVSVPPGGTVIQGATAGPAGLTYEVTVELNQTEVGEGFIQIKTPLGPVNLRLEKLRSLEGLP